MSTCATCRHWNPAEGQRAIGHCFASGITPAADMPIKHVDLMDRVTPEQARDQAFTPQGLMIRTGPDFGCIHHAVLARKHQEVTS